jgi:hypothetical protein
MWRRNQNLGTGISGALNHFLGYIMAIGIGAVVAVEAKLIRKLGDARRNLSAQERLARLQKEAKPTVGLMVRPVRRPVSEGAHDEA